MKHDSARPDLLLLNPPFCEPRAPYISIPTLSAYLRSVDVKVEAFDLNREFFQRLLQPARIIEGVKYCKERFLELNHLPELDFNHMVEYLLLWEMLISAGKQAGHFTPLLSGFADFSTIQLNAARMYFPALATAPDYPEGVVCKPNFITFTPFKAHSTPHMLASLEHEGPYEKNWQRILDEQIGRHDPRAVGFSIVYKDQMIAGLKCADYVKRKWPHKYVVLGGPFISIYLRELNEARLFGSFDGLILDEGELPLATLDAELKKSQPDFSRVPGLVYLHEGVIKRNPSAQAPPLNEMPLPDYDVWERDTYLDPKALQSVNLRLSKGCMWRKCAFCRTDLYFYKTYEPLDGAQAFAQVERLVKEQGIRSLHFSDEAADPKVLEELSRRILDSGLKVKWTTQTRVSPLLTRERARLYKEAGCFFIWLGAESMQDRLLKLLRKGISRRMTQKVLEDIAGELPLGIYMMIGIPTETEAEAEEGFGLVQSFMKKGLIKAYRYNAFRIAAYSEMAKHPGEFGIDRLHVPPHHDLNPNILNFDTQGMSRRTAYLLMNKYNTLASQVRQVVNPQTALMMNGKTLELRYDIAKLATTVMSHWEVSYFSFGEFLQHNQKTFTPLKPMGE